MECQPKGKKGMKRRTEGTRYFFLSIVGISVLSAFSQITLSVLANSTGGEKGTYWDPVWVLLTNPLSFRLALLCRYEIKSMRWMGDMGNRGAREKGGLVSQLATGDRRVLTERVFILELGANHYRDGDERCVRATELAFSRTERDELTGLMTNE